MCLGMFFLDVGASAGGCRKHLQTICNPNFFHLRGTFLICAGSKFFHLQTICTKGATLRGTVPGWDLVGSGLHISKTRCFYHVHLKNLGVGILRRLAPCKFRKPTVPQALQMTPPEFADALQHPLQHVATRISNALQMLCGCSADAFAAWGAPPTRPCRCP